MPWYAIRHVFLFQKKPRGVNVFEERMVCFKARSWKEAHAKAEKEADVYAGHIGAVVHDQQEGYLMDDADLVDGHEIWSMLYESAQTLNTFYRDHYESYRYRPYSPKQTRRPSSRQT